MFLKHLGSIFLLFALMMQSLLQLGMLTYYSINIDAITEDYCINKDKPEMCCKGKCYITKQLNQTSQDLPAKSSTINHLIPDIEVTELYSMPTPNVLSFFLSRMSDNLYLSQFTSEHLHPPNLI
jgi:hypothetical protein